MNVMEKLAAQRAKISAMKSALPEAPSTPQGWTKTPRTKRGKPVYEVYAVLRKPVNPVHKIGAYKRLDLDTLALTPGMTCPACLGSGMRVWGTCYWCNVPSTKGPGKGVLDARDIAFIEARRKGAGPICDVQAA